MMDSQREAEEYQFFDASDEVSSVSDLGSDSSGDCCSCSGSPGSDVNGLGYELWMKMPESAHRRRSRFMKWMGLSSDQNQIEEGESEETLNDEFKIEFDRIKDHSRAALRTMNLEDHVSCKEAELLGEDSRIVKSIDRTECLDGVTNSGMFSRFQEPGSNRAVTIDELQRAFESSSLDRWLLRRDAEADKLVDMKNKMKSGWLKTLFTRAHAAGRQKEADSERHSNSDSSSRLRKVPVHAYRKKLKELSSLYEGQEFSAHEGSILTMKFSPDGQYLASAGEDGIVRVWKVIEHEKPNKLDIQQTDSSSSYFSSDHHSKPGHKDRIGKMKNLKKSSESSCVVFPPKVFWIIEEPLHEFHGHSGEVLSLAWSNNGHLLSSSVDKTVRLWQVGHEQCLGVFFHNNYVTCVEFNPVDDTYFISGSIDGKVRIWEVHGCRVVDWIDIRDIVTAICYYPNGKGGIVGSMDGSCRFYNIIDNQLQLDAQTSLQGKNKLPSKRITGFQFSPTDPSKVLVTSADSQARVLSGLDVIFKFKGSRISGSQVGIAASFTGDGKHIVSASDDSNVCVWDSIRQARRASKPKKISSCESFSSRNASIAIPWRGMKTVHRPLSTQSTGEDGDLASCISGNEPFDYDSLNSSMASSSSHNCFSLTKGTATWPEENLSGSPRPMPAAVSPGMGCCQNPFTSSCHLWGLVIVTAGWDGQIRTYHNYGLPVRL